MWKLPLDDPRWSELRHRQGSAADVPARLRQLLDHPEDRAAFSDLWPYLCSEGTTHSAPFAAVPYIVEVCEKLPAGTRFEHLVFLGLVSMHAGPHSEGEDEVALAYADTRPRILAMLGEEIAFEHDAANTRYLLAAIAALKGYPKMATSIEWLDDSLP